MTAVIFDLDGTLIDSAPDIQAAVNAMLADQGQNALDLPTIVSFVGNGLPKLVERVIRHVSLDMAQHADLTQITLDHYAAHPASETRLYPGVEEALTTLQERGLKMGLCTNKPFGPTKNILEDMDLDRFFEAVVGGDSLPQRKPNPAPLLATAKALESTRYIFVGDSEIDAETAERAPAPFLLFTEGYRKSPVNMLPHADSFDHFEKLPALVELFN